MDLFQVKTGWRRVRKRENKNYRSVPTRLLIENSKKKFQKHSKNKKNTIVASFQAEKEKNKNYRFVSFQLNA